MKCSHTHVFINQIYLFILATFFLVARPNILDYSRRIALKDKVVFRKLNHQIQHFADFLTELLGLVPRQWHTPEQTAMCPALAHLTIYFQRRRNNAAAKE